MAPNSQFIAFQTTKILIRMYSLPDLKPICSIQTSKEVNEISFFGPDSRRILAVGTNFAKIYRYTNKRELRVTYNLKCDLDLERHSWFNSSQCLSCDKYRNFLMIEPKFNEIKPILVENNMASHDKINSQ